MYYRIQDANKNPQDLLNPSNWESTVWTGEVYKKCEACNGAGEIVLRNEDGKPKSDGYGDIETEPCEICNGDREVKDNTRHGISCCESLQQLENYFETRSADLANVVVVAFEGRESDEEDWDADEGAVLVFPSKIVWVKSLSEAGILTDAELECKRELERWTL